VTSPPLIDDATSMCPEARPAIRTTSLIVSHSRPRRFWRWTNRNSSHSYLASYNWNVGN